MFSVVRSVLAGVVVSLLLLLIHRYKPLTKKIAIGSAIGWIVLSLALGFLPFENAFVTFSSPEAAYECYNPTCDARQVVYGQQSDLVVGERLDGTTVYLIIPKSDTAWKLGRGIDTKTVYVGVWENICVTVCRYKKTDDYFIRVEDVYGNTLSIADNYGSKYLLYQDDHIAYYAHISSFDENYELWVDGEKIPLFNGSKILKRIE